MIKIVFKILIFIAALFCLVYIFFFSANILLAPSSEEGFNPEVCYKNDCFLVELAKTAVEREKGLMYRTFLAENNGMLFIFEKEAIYTFWMKNTLIPLDMIWLDSSGKVVFVSLNNQPCLSSDCPPINPRVLAKYILEINAGIVEELGIKTGESMEFSF